LVSFIPYTTFGISEWQGYLDGIPAGAPITGTPYTSVQTVLSLYLGCINANGTGSGDTCSGNMLAAAIYNIPLTPTQMNLIMTTMNAL
jgi:hypothetical protein